MQAKIKVLNIYFIIFNYFVPDSLVSCPQVLNLLNDVNYNHSQFEHINLAPVCLVHDLTLRVSITYS